MTFLATIALTVFPAGVIPQERQPAPVVTQLQDAFASVAERVFPSVVVVTSYVRSEPSPEDSDADTARPAWQVTRDGQRYPGYDKLRSGSGFLVDDEGRVLSLRQFVIKPNGEPADLVDIETQDGREILSRIVGLEPTLNVAVLEMAVLPTRNPPELVAAAVGDSDSMRVGYWALALGDPDGPEKSFTAGMVSALPERQCYQDDLGATYMLVSSTKLHPEAYGGPLVNIQGEVVGMTTPRLAENVVTVGFEYALPINIVLPVYNGITMQKSFASPWIGISVLEISAWRKRFRNTPGFQQRKRPRIGLYIDNVFEGSPAANAGIQVGDFVVRLDSRTLSSVFRFQEQLYLAGIGREVPIEIFRDGETQELSIRVEERPPEASPR